MGNWGCQKGPLAILPISLFSESERKPFPYQWAPADLESFSWRDSRSSWKRKISCCFSFKSSKSCCRSTFWPSSSISSSWSRDRKVSRASLRHSVSWECSGEQNTGVFRWGGEGQQKDEHIILTNGTKSQGRPAYTAAGRRGKECGWLPISTHAGGWGPLTLHCPWSSDWIRPTMLLEKTVWFLMLTII